jgi:hypothetical protein
MNLVIEEINRNRKVIQRYRFKDQNRIRIGRALDNDIILNEPHVSPHHMELVKTDDGGWVIIDLDSRNGVRTAKRKKIESGTQLKSGDTLLLGRCYLSIWDEQHPVEETWPLHSIEEVLHRISSPWVVVALMGLFVIGEWQLASMHNYRGVPPSRLVNELIYELLIILGWASLWSFSGRVIRHESRFYSHLAVTIVAAMAFQWVPPLLRILAFNGHYGLWLTELRYFCNGAIFSLLLWANFYLSLPQKATVRIIWSNAIAWSMVLVFLLPPIFDARKFRGYPLYDGLILPYSVFWADTLTPEAFLEKTESLYGKADSRDESNESARSEEDVQ